MSWSGRLCERVGHSVDEANTECCVNPPESLLLPYPAPQATAVRI